MKKVYVLGIDQMILPLTRKLVAEGVLPNLARLLDQGSANQAVSSFPPWTPTNWATIATGANTGTHGVFTWFVDMPQGEAVSSFDSHAVSAEPIWETLERQGLRSAVFHYPASMPSTLQNAFIIDGFAAPQHGSSPYEVSSSRGYTTLPDLPISDTLQLEPATGWIDLPASRRPILSASIWIAVKDKTLLRQLGACDIEPGEQMASGVRRSKLGDGLWLPLLVYASEGDAYDRVRICTSQDGGAYLADIGVEMWSDWTFLDIDVRRVPRRCSVRFKLQELSPDATRLRLYRSQVMPVEGFTHPFDLGQELVARFGPYQEHVSEFSNLCGITDFKTCLEEAEYQLQWFVKAGRYLLRERGADLFMCHWHFLDDINHHHLGLVDPDASRYDDAQAPAHWERIRQAYQIIDQAIGFLMDDMDADTSLFVVSDHGSLPLWDEIHLDRFLWERGFLVLKDKTTLPNAHDLQWLSRIDWEHTKAYVRQGFSFGPEIYINARATEREAIADAVIQALMAWRDERSGRCPISLALKKEDAGVLGFWGAGRGDIVLVTEGRYFVGRGESAAAITPVRGLVTASHAYQQLTFQTSLCSHMAMVIATGPDIKQGYERPVERLGRLHLRDLAPTLCHILGIAPPAQCEGRVAYDLFVGHETYRERRVPDSPRLWTEDDEMADSRARRGLVGAQGALWTKA